MGFDLVPWFSSSGSVVSGSMVLRFSGSLVLWFSGSMDLCSMVL